MRGAGPRGPDNLARMPTTSPTRMTPATVVLLLTLLLGIQPVTTDLYLPALPTLQRELGASVAAAQLTLSALIIAFGLAQLVCGPLADRFGRRPVLLAGMAAYTLASTFGALAATIEALIGWRALQGVAMAAAVTCGRSIVRDLYEPQDGARVMSRALSGLALIAGASPLCGGVLVQYASWHAALGVLALFGALTLAALAWRLDETLARPDPRATRLAPLLRNWAEVAAHPTFRAWAVLMCASYAGLFFILAGSSYVYLEVFGLSRIAFGAVLACNSAAYLAGTVACRWLLRRHGLRGAVWRGAWLSLAGGLGMAGLGLAGVHTSWAVLLPQCLFAAGHGIHQPCGQSAALGPFPDKAGTAASLSGFLMMLCAFGVGLLLGRTIDGTVYPMTLGVGACSVALAATAWTLVQRDGEPRLAPAGSRP